MVMMDGINAQQDTFQKVAFMMNLLNNCNRPEYKHLWTA